MVVICGAVPSMVRSVRLYNDCSKSDVRVDMKGRVLANDDNSDRFQNLTIRSLDFHGKLTIYAEESRRYLCFNRKWKLVGSKKFKGPMCEFYEDMFEGAYSQYRSAANKTHLVGFNRRGRPLRRGMKECNREKSFNFLKFDQEFSINHHNQKLAGGNNSAELPAQAQRNLMKNKQFKGSAVKKPNRQNRKNVYPRLRHKNHHRNSEKLS